MFTSTQTSSRRSRWNTAATLSIVLLFAVTPNLKLFGDDPAPVVHDPRLQLTLISEDPDIVTPIGLAIDERDRLFVLESHTHERPSDYEGPKLDRVKMFTDADDDGKFESISNFTADISTGLNLAFSPDGVLYVVCAREVVRLPDTNGDGICDGPNQVLKLRTNEGYSHNCLLGITFDRDGWMYVSRGNTGSRAYEFVGSDGSRVGGYGDGGSIVRCRPDGTQLTEFATGFWNPFEMKFDHAGRLLCVDNDPDARGPNRLVHVVPGGDYGYKSLYGGSGNHPFQGWDGSLPGTLPLISGTGEAPCDLIDCRQTSLPSDYADSVLVTVWNENKIERHAMQPQGVSLTAKSSVLISGGDNFRPVAIEADSRGNIYFTDWVLVAYPNHGRGRLWRLSTGAASDNLTPRDYFHAPDDDRASLVKPVTSIVELRGALASSDPFERHAAVMALAIAASEEDLVELASDPNAKLRLAGLLVAQRTRLSEAVQRQLARRFLADSNEEVRRAALVWAGTSLMTSLRLDIDKSIEADDVSPLLFETYLAAVQNLEPEFARAVRERTQERAKAIVPHLDETLILRIAADEARPPSIRALAVMRIDDARKHRKLLLELAGSTELSLRLAAIRRMSGNSASDVREMLASFANDIGQDELVRCEALLSLSKDVGIDPRTILPLLDDPAPTVAVEAARTLRQFRNHAVVKAAAGEKWDRLGSKPFHTALGQQLAFLLEIPSADRPTSSDEAESLVRWQRALAQDGDPQAGRRVFYSTHATCANCHTTNGLGGTLGPDLSNIAQSIDRQQIIRSILRPSDQFPPQYQAWIVLTTDGLTYTGLQLDHKSGGAINLFTIDGKSQHFKAEEIEAYRASSQSIMPSGLEANLSLNEFRDLVAYLESLR